MGTICQPLGTSEYRRLSYTGIAGPTSITDHIVVKLPNLDSSQKLKGIQIRTGSWPAEIGKVYMYTQDLTGSGTHVVPQFGANAIKAGARKRYNSKPASRQKQHKRYIGKQ